MTDLNQLELFFGLSDNLQEFINKYFIELIELLKDFKGLSLTSHLLKRFKFEKLPFEELLNLIKNNKNNNLLILTGLKFVNKGIEGLKKNALTQETTALTPNQTTNQTTSLIYNSILQINTFNKQINNEILLIILKINYLEFNIEYSFDLLQFIINLLLINYDLKTIKTDLLLEIELKTDFKILLINALRDSLLKTTTFYNNKFIILLILSTDMDQTVLMKAEHELTRFTATIDYNNTTLIDFLVKLYFMEIPTHLLLLRLKILNLLQKSILATNQFPNNIKIISHSLFTETNSVKVINSGLLFMIWCLRVGNESLNDMFCTIVLSLLLKFVEGDYNNQLLSLAFECFPLVSKRG